MLASPAFHLLGFFLPPPHASQSSLWPVGTHEPDGGGYQWWREQWSPLPPEWPQRVGGGREAGGGLNLTARRRAGRLSGPRQRCYYSTSLGIRLQSPQQLGLVSHLCIFWTLLAKAVKQIGWAAWTETTRPREADTNHASSPAAASGPEAAEDTHTEGVSRLCVGLSFRLNCLQARDP